LDEALQGIAVDPPVALDRAGLRAARVQAVRALEIVCAVNLYRRSNGRDDLVHLPQRLERLLLDCALAGMRRGQGRRRPKIEAEADYLTVLLAEFDAPEQREALDELADNELVTRRKKHERVTKPRAREIAFAELTRSPRRTPYALSTLKRAPKAPI
jgi:hypothetical protein